MNAQYADNLPIKIIYCYQCNNYYCNKCISIHNKDINKAYNMINSIEKNIKCKEPNKIYDKYCFKYFTIIIFLIFVTL